MTEYVAERQDKKAAASTINNELAALCRMSFVRANCVFGNRYEFIKIWRMSFYTRLVIPSKDLSSGGALWRSGAFVPDPRDTPTPFEVC